MTRFETFTFELTITKYFIVSSDDVVSNLRLADSCRV